MAIGPGTFPIYEITERSFDDVAEGARQIQENFKNLEWRIHQMSPGSLDNLDDAMILTYFFGFTNRGGC